MTPLLSLHRATFGAGAPLSLAHQDLVIRGRVEGSDTRDTFSWRFGDQGRFLRETRGVLGRTAGSDGDSTWLHDAGGRSRRLELGDAENTNLLSAVLSGRWLDPESGVTVAAGPESSDGLTRVDLVLGRHKARLAIDPASGEPRVLELRPSFGGETWTFAEFAKKDDVVYPRKIEQTLAVGVTDRYVVESAQLQPAFPAKDYARPKGGAGTRFDRTIAPALSVERSENGFLLVHPKIDGREVGAFIFDTGAGTNVITPKLADSLGLAKTGTSWVGMAAGAATAGVRTAKSVSLGPLTIENPIFLELDLDSVSNASGATIVGIIGYDVLMRAIVEIEVETSRIAIHEPSSFASQDVRWEPIAIAGNHPHVNGHFDGHDGLFRLDTGAPQVPVIFNGPAVESLKLLDGRETQKAQIGLPGGQMDVAVGPVEGLEIGGHRFGTLSAIFPLQRGGAFDDEYTLGNLGQECLKPFRAVFDYEHRRMALIERPAAAAVDTKR